MLPTGTPLRANAPFALVTAATTSPMRVRLIARTTAPPSGTPAGDRATPATVPVPSRMTSALSS